MRAAEPVQPILMVFRRMLLLLSSIKGVLKDGGQESARGFIKFSPCYVTTDEKSNLDVGANNNKDAAADDFFFLEKKIILTVVDSITKRTSGSKHYFILFIFFFTCAQFIINRMETGGIFKVYVFARAKLQLLV